MKIIMLDGYCAGQIFESDKAYPEWKVVKPVNTHCLDADCPLSSPETITYKRTFISEDGRIALYTTDGKSERLLDGRDWVAPTKYAGKKQTVFFMGQNHTIEAIGEERA